MDEYETQNFWKKKELKTYYVTDIKNITINFVKDSLVKWVKIEKSKNGKA